MRTDVDAAKSANPNYVKLQQKVTNHADVSLPLHGMGTRIATRCVQILTKGDEPCKCFAPSPQPAAGAAGAAAGPCSGPPWWTAAPRFALAPVPTAAPAGAGTPLQPDTSSEHAYCLAIHKHRLKTCVF